jgi:hypothetical protein
LKSLGISITRNSLSVVLWEQTLFASGMVGACTVPCDEPFGGPGDIARLAEEAQKIAGAGSLPAAVLSLPPAWTFLRRVTLPVPDLPRAKKMHIAELEGNLPIEDEEILSDILPSPAGETGTFLAIAARRSSVEKTVAAFTAAGFRPDRAITDHVSLLCAVLSSKDEFSGLVFSDRNDLVALRLSGGTVASARQFPESIVAAPEELKSGIREVLDAHVHGILSSHTAQPFRPSAARRPAGSPFGPRRRPNRKEQDTSSGSASRLSRRRSQSLPPRAPSESHGGPRRRRSPGSGPRSGRSSPRPCPE